RPAAFPPRRGGHPPGRRRVSRHRAMVLVHWDHHRHRGQRAHLLRAEHAAVRAHAVGAAVSGAAESAAGGEEWTGRSFWRRGAEWTGEEAERRTEPGCERRFLSRL